MQNITGKPELMKKMNTTLIYKALIDMKSATRAEISDRTKISATTVRTLLEELLRRNEITELELDESSGGRRAQRYTLNCSKNLILSLYVENKNLVYQVSNLLGDIEKSSEIINAGEDDYSFVLGFIDDCLEKWDISAVAFGAPGIEKEGSFYVSCGLNQWAINDIGKQIKLKYNMPVIFENDLNAVAVGFALRYAEVNTCDINNINIVYIHFNDPCIGAGIITGGKIVYGAKQFAGELGFMPFYEQITLEDALKYSSSIEESTDIVYRIISILNCVTNPAAAIIGGNRFTRKWIDFDLLRSKISNGIASVYQPEIIFSKGYRDDYLKGLAHIMKEALIPQLPLMPGLM